MRQIWLKLVRVIAGYVYPHISNFYFMNKSVLNSSFNYLKRNTTFIIKQVNTSLLFFVDRSQAHLIMAAWVCSFLTVFLIMFFSFTRMSLFGWAFLNWVTSLIFLYFGFNFLRGLKSARISIKTSEKKILFALLGFSLNKLCDYLLEFLLFTIKTSIFLVSVLFVGTGSILLLAPLAFLTNHSYPFPELPEHLMQMIGKWMGEMNWSDYYKLLDEVLRPHFFPESLPSNTNIAEQSTILKTDSDLGGKAVLIDSSVDKNLVNIEKPVEPKKNEDQLGVGFWFATSVVLFAILQLALKGGQ